ncbi:four-carbon acid sugar kinase family protein [Tropicibacter sp. S64]|uniref:four-carbon acid sugar kinase family protein n=1 Tax=Tropicibacter sp. S64 TaxID=3415122 RepID=UPI003C7DA415
MPLLIVIIADDLTGALDAAAPFAGIPGGVAVATKPEAVTDCPAGASVLSVSTRSRDIPPQEAAGRVHAVLSALPAGVALFKKVDSRLKGNLAAELAPLPGPLLVAPALPEFGRVVRGGAVHGFGVAKPIAVRDRLGPEAHRATIPDVETAEEMDHALSQADPHATLVGSRGLAAALARRIGLVPQALAATLPAPAVMIVGSTDAITLGQVSALKAACPDLRHVEAPSGDVPAPQDTPRLTLVQSTPGPERPAQEVARHLAEGALPWIVPARGVLCTGGATAEALFDAMGLTLLTLSGEVLPGLPVATANGRVIVTKSGGFGERDCLMQLVQTNAAAPRSRA